MTKLILIRHGERVFNLKARYTGQTDVPLTEKGIEQAKITAEYILKNYKIDAVYSSDLARAIDTARPVAEPLGLKIKTDNGVWEAELYDVSISGTVAERLGAPLAPFLQSNNAISAEIKNSAGDGAQTLITVQTDCGTLEYLIDSKSGLPIFLREKGISGDVIMEFKISDYKIQKTN